MATVGAEVAFLLAYNQPAHSTASLTGCLLALPVLLQRPTPAFMCAVAAHHTFRDDLARVCPEYAREQRWALVATAVETLEDYCTTAGKLNSDLHTVLRGAET
jgi:hypothetical protein